MVKCLDFLATMHCLSIFYHFFSYFLYVLMDFVL